MIGFGCHICQKINQNLGIHDHKSIVLDEFIGMWFVLIMLKPCSMFEIFFSLILYRICDIWKPWPIAWFDKNIRGGFGVIFDDLIAALIVVVLIVFYDLFNKW